MILMDEEKILPYTTHRFIKQLFGLFFLDLPSLQQYVQERIHKKQLVPIPLAPQLVLFPLRSGCREELRTRGFLWAVHRRIEHIRPCKLKRNHSEIIFSSQHKIMVPYTNHFVQQQIRDSYYIEFCFQHTPLASPHEQRPSLSGQALSFTPAELQVQLLRIAESIRNYPSP